MYWDPASDGRLAGTANMSTQTLDKIRADFDRIALLLSRHGERAEPYDAFLLAQVPNPCSSLLEVGCGAGRLARILATRADHVLGIDASPEMIALARSRSGAVANLRFECVDFMTRDFGTSRYDCVFTVTTLHHLATAPALVRMKSLLTPGGRLIIQDVRAMSGKIDWLWSGFRATANGDVRHWWRRRVTGPRDLALAWQAHGVGESYLAMSGVCALCAEHLPGADVHNHPLSRYTIVWTKPLAEA